MRSFAVVAGFAVAANAYAYGYDAPQNSTTPAAPVYGAPTTSVGYPASSPPAVYGGSSTSVGYPSWTTIKGLTTVCPGSTTLTVGTKTYTVTKSTTIIDNDCTWSTTISSVKTTPASSVKPSSTPAGKPSSTPAGKSSSAPVVKPSSSPAAGTPPAVPYPSKNGTAPTYPIGTSVPTSTKPSVSQFTGAAAQTGAAMLAVAGGLFAALL